MHANKQQQGAKATTRERFPEPRGWALNWNWPLETNSAAEQMAERSNGTGRKFPEPSGWAARWDGAVLSETLRRENGKA